MPGHFVKQIVAGPVDICTFCTGDGRWLRHQLDIAGVNDATKWWLLDQLAPPLSGA
jgi:hypothetical protein